MSKNNSRDHVTDTFNLAKKFKGISGRAKARLAVRLGVKTTVPTRSQRCRHPSASRPAGHVHNDARETQKSRERETPTTRKKKTRESTIEGDPILHRPVQAGPEKNSASSP